jgi:hypothetical protein
VRARLHHLAHQRRALFVLLHVCLENNRRLFELGRRAPHQAARHGAVKAIDRQRRQTMLDRACVPDVEFEGGVPSVKLQCWVVRRFDQVRRRRLQRWEPEEGVVFVERVGEAEDAGRRVAGVFVRPDARQRTPRCGFEIRMADHAPRLPKIKMARACARAASGWN